MKPTLISIIIIAILALVIASMYASDTKPKESLQEGAQSDEPASENEATHVYNNEVYGYTLSAPERMSFKEYTPEILTVAIGDTSIADVRVVAVSPEAEQSFVEAVGSHLQMLCAADGPQASFSCTSTEVIEPFDADSGDEGYLLFLHGELTNLQTQEITDVQKGPYFVFPLHTNEDENEALVVHAPLNLSADEADAVAIRDIAASVQIQEAQ